MKDLRPTVRGFGLSLGALVAVACGAAGSSCAPSGFASVTSITSVRILASAADKPYAKPGDSVTVNVLAFDGRKDKREPMTLYWLPLVCENPIDDAYFGCFKQIGGGAGGGAPGAPGAGVSLKPGVALTPLLPTGPSFTFQMPADAITSHPPVAGASAPYGLAILFNIACAGHIELLPIDPNNVNPQQVPIGCFDSSHNQLGPDDWVFGFTRVYAYADITNANPVISGVDIDGKTFFPDMPAPKAMNGTLTVQHCSDNCKEIPIGPIVPASSQETQMQTSSGSPRKEEIWADFFSTVGQYKSDARLLYDANSGSIGDLGVTDNKFTAPSDPGSGLLWIVVHDNRGGASWVTIPLSVE